VGSSSLALILDASGLQRNTNGEVMDLSICANKVKIGTYFGTKTEKSTSRATLSYIMG